MPNYLDFDPKKDKYLIAKYYFNSIPPNQFLKFVSGFFNKVGNSDSYHGCFFPDKNDEDPFLGVLFLMLQERLVVNQKVFDELLLEACAGFAKLFPAKRERVK